MTAHELVILSLSVESILYLLLILLALRRGHVGERMVRNLMAYAALSGLWVLAQLGRNLGWLALLGINDYVAARLPLYGVLVLALLFLHLTRSFLRLGGRAWGWTVLVVVWLAGLVAIDAGLVDVAAWLPILGQWNVGRLSLSYGATVAGWGLFMVAAFLLTVRSYRQTKLPLHRNRLTFWLIAWTLTLAGDLVFFGGHEIIGSDVRLVGTLAAAYVVLIHRLRDVRQTMRRSLSYLVMTALTVVIYTGGFAAVQYFFENLPGYDPLLAGAAVALLLAVLFDPLLGLVQRLVNRLIAGTGYDPRRTVSEYSQSISNIVDLERLATVVVGLLSEVLEIRQGTLFLVNTQKGPEGAQAYKLQGIRGMGQEAAEAFTLGGDSPVTYHLREKRQPLTQYDIDLLPAFHDLAEAERGWLAGLEMDVYVPIHAADSWLGVLALGSKVSGDRYFDEDLELLSTLADQTAVALENARLVDDLVRLNLDLQNTYMALARANRQLQEMDRLKSAFIGVITHELRTPFANIAFSLQLFTRYGIENLSDEQRDQLAQLRSSLTQAKGMVDNLVTFATFLSKQGELELVPVDFRQVIRDTLTSLRSLMEGKELTLHVILSEELPLLRGDPDKLADAVHHLVHNAIKFTPENGEIWVRSTRKDGHILFEVRDNGVGVPADKLPMLWEGFNQMADPLQRGVEGLGLGLALVKYIVTAHEGQVWAESEVGAGSTFGFEVPLAGPKGPEPEGIDVEWEMLSSG
jgi:signal transduction histidine kinase